MDIGKKKNEGKIHHVADFLLLDNREFNPDYFFYLHN